jgi:hypothetical protein
MKRFVLALVLATFSVGVADESEFYVQEGVVKKIYNDIKTEKDAKSSAEMSVGAEWLSLSDLYLSSKYFDVDYKGNVGSLQSANVGFSTNIVSSGRLDFDIGGNAGYGFKRGSYRARSSTGSEVQDDISLQWIPVRLKANVAYDIFNSSIVRPEVEGGVGSHWLTQSGNLDGMTQSFWIPTYFGGAQFRFFGSAKDDPSSFSGIILGSRYEKQFSDSQKFSSVSYYLSANFKL